MKTKKAAKVARSLRNGKPLTLVAWKTRLAAGYYTSAIGAKRATGHAVRCKSMTAGEKKTAEKLLESHRFDSRIAKPKPRKRK